MTQIKKAISPLEWQEFNNRKVELFADRYIAIELSLNDEILNRSSAFRADLLKKKKDLIKAKIKISDLNVFLKKSGKLPMLNSASIISILDSSIKDIERYLTSDFDSDQSTEKIKRGAKPYPYKLAKWIYDSIELAKGDKVKLQHLIKFFKSGGEFDKWISEKSGNKRSTPLLSTKKYENKSFENESKRLRSLKREMKKIMQKTKS